MSRLLLAISVTSLLVACATTSESGPQAAATITEEPSAPRPTTVERMGFTAPLPEGWEEVKNERALQLTGENGAAIANPNIMAVPNYNPASIVIRPVTRMDTDPKDPEACTKTGNGLAKALQSTVESASIVTLPATQETCQVSLAGVAESQGGTDRRTRATIMGAPNNNYVLTCYYDGRDEKAAATCDQVLQGFTFKAVAAPEPAPAPETTPAETSDAPASTGSN